MRDGNWTVISKNARLLLPKDRPYSGLEALYSLQCDHADECTATVAGYGALWQWSRGKVARFLEGLNVAIEYPEGSEKTRNKRGHIMIHKADIKRTNNRQIRLIDSRQLDDDTDIKQAKSEHKTDIKQSTTNKLRLKLNKHMVNFDQFWAIYPKKQGRQQAIKAWEKIEPDSTLFDQIMAALNAQSLSEDWQKDNGTYVPHPSSWLNGSRWEDELKPEQNQHGSGSQLVGGKRVI
ncbi:MAG: hypothetical protein JRG71_04640 [Deltaproteobacteria bacterium]|nr:hypothetical protein [Deltaproteobacteria bacterium]